MSEGAARPDGSASAPFRIAVVVVNFRGAGLVLDCLATLLPELSPHDVVVVVDNRSDDDSVPRLRAAIAANGWDAVRLVAHDRNDGFSAGNNVGLAAVEAEAYLLLNSDTLVRAGALSALWDALQRDPAIGLVSPRLEWPDGRPQESCFRDPGAASELLRGAATGPLTRLLPHAVVALPPQERPTDCAWTSFAAVLVRRAVVQRIGPMDEGYFMFFEDADYCRLARAAGFRVHHEPAARIVHLRGGSSPVKALAAARQRRPAYWYAARARYFRKHGGGAGLLRANLAFTAGRALAWLRETLGRKAPHTCEREVGDTWRGGAGSDA